MTILQGFLLVLISAGITSAVTPLVARLARSLEVVDRPSDRSVSHRQDMPLLGGFAVALGTVVGLSVVIEFVLGIPQGISSVEGFLIGGAVMLAIGALDDRYSLSASPKLVVQIIAASVAIAYGFRVEEFREPLSGIEFHLPLWLSWAVTTLWIVGVTNAMNLIDGIDGEATGIGAIIALTLAVICWQAGQLAGAALGLALVGALLGFLPFNFPPARIFLGDTGALFLGFALSILALEGYEGGSRKVAVLTFAVPLMALAVPILDTLLSIYRRLRGGQPIFSADNRHMHDHLMAIRGSPRMAVLSLYFLTACFCILAVSFSQLEGYTAFIFFGAVIVLTFRLLSNLGALSVDRPTEPDDAADSSPAQESRFQKGTKR